MLTLKFHKFKDKQPKIGDDIIYLRVGHNFYCDTLEFKECTVEADWMVFEDNHMWALSKNVWKSFDKALEEK